MIIVLYRNTMWLPSGSDAGFKQSSQGVSHGERLFLDSDFCELTTTQFYNGVTDCKSMSFWIIWETVLKFYTSSTTLLSTLQTWKSSPLLLVAISENQLRKLWNYPAILWVDSLWKYSIQLQISMIICIESNLQEFTYFRNLFLS